MTEEPSNPYQMALGLISAAAIVLGLILLGVGSSMANDYMSHSDGAGQMLWGGALGGLGLTGLLLWLTASAIIWKPGPARQYSEPGAAWAEAKTPPAAQDDWP